MIEEIKDTSASVWISASAGTGKTKNLIDRILALLLNGAEPSHILCLTYTKAAATEMQDRLHDYFQNILNISDNEIYNELFKIGFSKPYFEQIKKVAKNHLKNNWVNIQTIHSFALSLLKKFPMETGLYPGIKQCDDNKKQELLENAFNYVLQQEFLYKHLENISHYTLNILDDNFKNNNMKIMEFLWKFPQDSDIQNFFLQYFDISEKTYYLSDEELQKYLLKQSFGDYQTEFKKIIQEVDNYQNLTTKTDKNKASELKKALQKVLDNHYDEFIQIILTEKFEPRSLKGVKSKELRQLFQDISNKTLNYLENKRKIKFVKLNISYFTVINQIIKNFIQQKNEQHLIDFNDMIIQTRNLLQSNFGWVFYKIDQNIDHLLIDEAQDTSPEQWEIIKLITSDFFNDNTIQKTIFVVGDEKQSIYSFQGADVSLFKKMYNEFKERSLKCGQRFHTVSLNKSFRSDGNILKFVDNVFSSDFPGIKHIPNDNTNDGVVEIFDLFEDEQDLVNSIVNIIYEAIKNKIPLKKYSRTAEARDFLILFRRRNINLMNKICAELNKKNVPVSGVDRILLKEEPVIEDLIALAEFTQFPLDDLMLARVLKSPIIGMTEQDLMNVCLARQNQKLWYYILNNIDSYNKYDIHKLQKYSELKLSCYDFFSYILMNGLEEKFINTFGSSCINIINEFLSTCFKFEKEYSPILSDFLIWFDKFEQKIEKQYDNNQNAVRLMTVHSSKGLQSPFIIIADAHFTKNKSDNILIDNKDQTNPKLFWNFGKDHMPKSIQKLSEQKTILEKEEADRLLYVALTRAESFLYILGQKQKQTNNCWYQKLTTPNIKTLFKQDNNISRLGSYPIVANQLSNNTSVESGTFSMPEWYYEKLPNIEPKIINSIKTQETEFGDCVHLLLKNLSIYGHDILIVAKELTSNFNLPQHKKKEAINTSILILNKFPQLFTAETQAEVTFFLDGKEGRIDKIAKINNEIWIVDFKTGTPKNPIPKEYIEQLLFYQRAYQIISKQKAKIAILWTETLELVTI